MSDYINRRLTMQRFCYDCKGLDGPHQCEYSTRGCQTMKVMFTIPSADVEPVRHGKWVDDGDPLMAKCSICGYGVMAWNNGVNYCPNCGAKMEENKE